MLFWTGNSDNNNTIANSNTNSNIVSANKKYNNQKTTDERCILTERLQWHGEGYGQGHIPIGNNYSLFIIYNNNNNNNNN